MELFILCWFWQSLWTKAVVFHLTLASLRFKALPHILTWIEVWTPHQEIDTFHLKQFLCLSGSMFYFHSYCMYLYEWKHVCVTWQGCYWVRLSEIPDSSAAVCLGSLTLIPGCTSWLIWSSPSGFGPNQQTHTVGTQTRNNFVLCIYICRLTVYNWYYFHKKAQRQGTEGNSQA